MHRSALSRFLHPKPIPRTAVIRNVRQTKRQQRISSMTSKRAFVLFALIVLIPRWSRADDHQKWNDLVRPLKGSSRNLDIIVTVRPSVEDEKLIKLHQAVRERFEAEGFDVSVMTPEEHRTAALKRVAVGDREQVFASVHATVLESGGYIHFATLSLSRNGFFLNPSGFARVSIPHPVTGEAMDAGSVVTSNCVAFQTEGAPGKSTDWSGVVAAVTAQVGQYAFEWRRANR